MASTSVRFLGDLVNPMHRRRPTNGLPFKDRSILPIKANDEPILIRRRIRLKA